MSTCENLAAEAKCPGSMRIGAWGIVVFNIVQVILLGMGLFAQPSLPSVLLCLLGIGWSVSKIVLAFLAMKGRKGSILRSRGRHWSGGFVLRRSLSLPGVGLLLYYRFGRALSWLRGFRGFRQQPR